MVRYNLPTLQANTNWRASLEPESFEKDITHKNSFEKYNLFATCIYQFLFCLGSGFIYWGWAFMEKYSLEIDDKSPRKLMCRGKWEG